MRDGRGKSTVIQKEETAWLKVSLDAEGYFYWEDADAERPRQDGRGVNVRGHHASPIDAILDLVPPRAHHVALRRIAHERIGPALVMAV